MEAAVLVHSRNRIMIIECCACDAKIGKAGLFANYRLTAPRKPERARDSSAAC